MADLRLRELERIWQQSGLAEDETRLLLAQQRAGILTASQIYMAAYLGNEGARGCHATGLYDVTGEFNDHIEGICPCPDCKWGMGFGYKRWIDGVLGWAQNLPFPGIDGPHAEQEALIRMGRALAASVWEQHYTPEDPCGAYVTADLRADRFLAEPDKEEARAWCRVLWEDEDSGLPEWAHQVLYYIVNPSGWRQNAFHFFRESAVEMGNQCSRCDGSGSLEETYTDPAHFGMPYTEYPTCSDCKGFGSDSSLEQAREVVETALLPWVLSPAPTHTCSSKASDSDKPAV
jgi:hypothetical protein